MKVEFLKNQSPDSLKGLICYFLIEDQLPKELEKLMASITKERFGYKQGQTVYFDSGEGRKVLIVGLGKKDEFKLDYLRRATGSAVRCAVPLKEKEVNVVLEDIDQFGQFGPLESAIQAIVEGGVLASYKSTEFKTKKDDLFTVEKLNLVVTVKGAESSKNTKHAIEHGLIYANAQNYAREVDERPANIATPQYIADEAVRLAKAQGFKATVFDKDELKRMGMRGILAVCQGSLSSPVLIKLEYNLGKKNLPLYCIVGKGVTFDTGGISIKPSKNMHEMKYDKTGAINVLGIFKAVSELKLQIRLVGLMPMVENMPSGTAQRPGDIIKAYNGKTIEVLNTDAEGRLILADALAYAAEQKPEVIIDMATLTGAVIVSLGRFAIGMFSNDDKLGLALHEAGDETHERVWRMPLWPEYGELMKSDFADLKNISELDEAGSITATAFLKEFIGECKWAHLDIAAVDLVKWPHPYLEKGASGISVRLVTRVLEKFSRVSTF